MTGPSFANTRLTRAQYVAHWNDDLDRFISAAEGHLTVPVPTCPAWLMGDLAHHLANVYEHKTWVLDGGEFPDEARFAEERARRLTEEPLERLRRWSAALQLALLARPVGERAATFMDNDQTVEFWFRRMALETLVHRTDAQIAGGELGPMDSTLSLDGVDELLWFWWQHHETPNDRWRGQRVALVSGPTSWVVQLDAEHPLVEMSHRDTAVASVSAPPGDLLLWVAGRDVRPVNTAGDPAAIELLREQFSQF